MKPIYVTQPSLPPIEEYLELLKQVWASGILTHNGPLVQKLEKGICNKLNIDNFVAVSSGTIAIQMSIKALDLKGEIITPAFTWIATVSAIKWEGCEPIFCDIDPQTLNINPLEIEKHITEKTVAIMPVHVFGNPCNLDEIGAIASQYNLKVIYDAAHAIGTKYKGKIDDRLLQQILVDDNPQRIAEVLATIDEALIMQGKGMGPNQIMETIRSSWGRKKNAHGGLAKILEV